MCQLYSENPRFGYMNKYRGQDDNADRPSAVGEEPDCPEMAGSGNSSILKAALRSSQLGCGFWQRRTGIRPAPRTQFHEGHALKDEHRVHGGAFQGWPVPALMGKGRCRAVTGHWQGGDDLPEIGRAH